MITVLDAQESSEYHARVGEGRDCEYAEALLRASFDRFDRFSETLPTALAGLLRDVRSRWLDLTPGDAPATNFFLGAGGTPAFVLLVWLAESIDCEDAAAE